MHLTCRNVEEAFRRIVLGIHQNDIKTRQSSSRNGPVLYVPEPVTLTYTHPWERVLFNRARDCNPFFHLYEAIWMLAGRNDVAPIDYFNSQMKQYSDDGQTFNGAYGYRWRHTSYYYFDEPAKQYRYNECDQLNLLVEHLKNDPDSRRAVLQMWDVGRDLTRIETSKDVCCNLCAMFSIREETARLYGKEENPREVSGHEVKDRYLDMTVVNRSNDTILGMLGANAVHFSVLQEYLAACLGIRVGVYNQITNNMHVYLKTWEPEKWLEEYKTLYLCEKCAGIPLPDTYVSFGVCSKCGEESITLRPHPSSTQVDYGGMQHFPLVIDPLRFDKECKKFIAMTPQSGAMNWEEPFLQKVLAPMVWAFRLHKRREYNLALNQAGLIAAPDWRNVCVEWLCKRQEGWDKRQKERQDAKASAK